LVVEDQDDAPEIDAKVLTRIVGAFAQGTGDWGLGTGDWGLGTGDGLVRLGAGEAGRALPPVFSWWRGFAARYVGPLCLRAFGTDLEAVTKVPVVPPPTSADLASLGLTAPVMAGAEYLAPDVLSAMWTTMARSFAASLAVAGMDFRSFLTSFNPSWNQVGRVHFNPAENRRDAEQPFAFTATCTTRLSAQTCQ